MGPSGVLAVGAALALSFSSQALASCSCGYRDPVTGALWTDATITYFNETATLSELTHSNTTRPAPYELGNITSFTEYDFSATYRTADWPSNVALNNWNGLELSALPPIKDHIVPGSSIRTVREDILYGSLRVQVKPPDPNLGGTALTLSATYNDSSYLEYDIMTKNKKADAAIRYSLGTGRQSFEPVTFNLSSLDDDEQGWDWHEHRIDWLPDDAYFSNDASNKTLTLHVDGKHVDLPTVPAPFEVRHWSNGANDTSQGPPTKSTRPEAYIRYMRLFYNSSLPARQQAFVEGCRASSDQVCSTEDDTIRDNTPFDMASTLPYVYVRKSKPIPLYSIYMTSISGGLFVILMMHAIASRVIKARASKKAQAPPSQGTEHVEPPEDKDVEGPGYWDEDDSSTKADSVSGRDKKGWDVDALEDQLEGDAKDKSKYTWNGQRRSILTANLLYVPPLYLQDASLDGQGKLLDYVMALESAAQPSGGAGIYSASTPAVETPVGEWAADDAAPESGMEQPAPAPSASRYLSRASSFMDIPGYGGPATPIYPSTPWAHLPPGPLRLVPWEPSKDEEENAAVGTLAVKKGKPWDVEKPRTLKEKLKAAYGKLFVGGSAKKTASGTARVEYLDGLRGFACFAVSFHHFMLTYYIGCSSPRMPRHYPEMEKWWRILLQPILMNGGLNVGIFFVLSARVIANRYLVKGRMMDLAEATFRRLPRLAVPITAGVVLNYLGMEVGIFNRMAHLSSRTWSTWPYIVDYNNLGYALNDWLELWFTIPPGIPNVISTYATGILWTVPIIVQTSWTVFTCALVSREMTNPKKRFSFYLVCILLSWYANDWGYFFLTGLAIADADNLLNYRDIAAKGLHFIPFARLRARLPALLANATFHGQWLAWLLFFIGAAFRYVEGATEFNIVDLEFEAHPDWTSGYPEKWTQNAPTYQVPRFYDYLWVMATFLLCDLSPAFSGFFRLKIWSALGRNAFSLYLLHGFIFWSWGAWLQLALLNVGWPYWAATLFNLVTSYAWLAVLCELFTRTFDNWGISFSRALWREATGGLGRRL